MRVNRTEAWRRFVAAADKPDAEIDMALCAMLIAATAHPDLDVQYELGLLDSLASAASRRLGSERDPIASVNLLSEYLFDEVGFRGNLEDYYDPCNSFLNDVLARRLGIPISLSLVYVEVGKRLGMSLSGVGMPGHFLVAHPDIEGLLIDPFDGGVLLSERECADRLRQVTQSQVPWDRGYLNPISNRQFVARMLRNLKGIYVQRQDLSHTLGILDLLIILQPDALHERRDRGLVHHSLGNYTEALDDLRSYLEPEPQGRDVETIRGLVSRLERSPKD